jgi:hypothetical protein
MTSPSTATIKRLFAVSANRCAFPNCEMPLVDVESGKVTGRICHIRARQAGGPRYDPAQSPGERNAFENLILMCPVHHDVIDSDTTRYTIEYLIRMKNESEQASDIGSQYLESAAGMLLAFFLSNSNQTGGQFTFHITNNIKLPNPEKEEVSEKIGS